MRRFVRGISRQHSAAASCARAFPGLNSIECLRHTCQRPAVTRGASRRDSGVTRSGGSLSQRLLVCKRPSPRSRWSRASSRFSGAEGAVALLERISPALENVDSSSGAIGTAVNHTIAELVSVIVAAPADERTRAAWLERLFEAHAADQIPYIERLAEYWGELCVYSGGRLGLGRPADRHHASGALTRQDRPRLLPRHLGVPERPLHGRAP